MCEIEKSCMRQRACESAALTDRSGTDYPLASGSEGLLAIYSRTGDIVLQSVRSGPVTPTI